MSAGKFNGKGLLPLGQDEAAAGVGVTDPYDILGVARDAGEEQIKAAYRKRAKAAHRFRRRYRDLLAIAEGL